jgi:CheY-like chemotaxis protein
MATILVVDDDSSIREFLCEYFASLGHIVCQAPSALIALDLVSGGQKFDLLLTDLQMPGLDGAGLITALRQTGCLQPMYVLTGWVQMTAVPGADGVLHKPFHLDQLQSLVERCS